MNDRCPTCGKRLGESPLKDLSFWVIVAVGIMAMVYGLAIIVKG